MCVGGGGLRVAKCEYHRRTRILVNVLFSVLFYSRGSFLSTFCFLAEGGGGGGTVAVGESTIKAVEPKGSRSGISRSRLHGSSLSWLGATSAGIAGDPSA